MTSVGGGKEVKSVLIKPWSVRDRGRPQEYSVALCACFDARFCFLKSRLRGKKLVELFHNDIRDTKV